TGLTDQTNFLSVGGIVFIEVTASQERHSPGFEISGSNLVTRHDLTLLDWRNITIAPRVKIATEANQRNIAADGRALERGNTAQRMECLFNKTLTRRTVWVLRGRQCNRTRPKILGTEAKVLLTQADETGDEQRSAGQQRDRERDLRANEDFAEALLAHTAARAAAAFFQAVNQIDVRTLKRRINSHQETGQDRQSNREHEHWYRQARCVVCFQRQKIGGYSRNQRHQLPRDESTDRARDYADEQTFENE